MRRVFYRLRPGVRRAGFSQGDLHRYVRDGAVAGDIFIEGPKGEEHCVQASDFERVEVHDTPHEPNIVKWYENLGKYEAFRGVMRGESDRACAVLGATYLDELLGQLLSEYFIADPVVVKLLGSDTTYGPLQTFSARIDICFALGLISALVRDDLNLIRDIRNRFAHRMEVHSFEESPFRELCAQFRALNGIPDWKEWKRDDLSRRLFELAVGNVMGEVNARIKSTVHLPPGNPIGSLYQRAAEKLKQAPSPPAAKPPPPAPGSRRRPRH